MSSRDLETGVSAQALVPLQWLREGLTAVYLDSDGIRLHIHVVPQDNDFLVRSKVEEPEDLKRLWKELNPDAKEEGYDEVTLDVWQQTQYGELFIDISKNPASHVILGVPAQYAGTAEAMFDGVSFSCIRMKTSKLRDCSCTDAGRHLFLYRGRGSCPRCGGILSSIRRCPRCGGSGKCPTCKGKGKFSSTTYFWYEEKTGLLLKYEHWREGERVLVMELEHLTPGILASGD